MNSGGVGRQVIRAIGTGEWWGEWVEGFTSPGDVMREEIPAGELGVVLNFSGGGELEPWGKRIGDGEGAVILRDDDRGGMVRDAGGIHRYFLIRFPREFLRVHCGEAGLAGDLRKWVGGGKGAADFSQVEPIPVALLGLRAAFLEPPVAESAQKLWYQCKAMEILTHLIFESPGRGGTESLRRQNQERCSEVLRLLRRDMENPPTLEMLAGQLGCSPFTLSRQFVAETGQSIPAALRAIRMEAAARMLEEGDVSVTDVAMKVGYSSLGAFMKAFAARYGCSPGQFARRNQQKIRVPKS